MCPVCMVWGMTPDDFWHGEPELIKYYREAYELKKEVKNQELWRLGLYIQRALMSTSGYTFGSKNNPPEYYGEPLPVTSRQIKEYEAKQMERQREEAKAFILNAQQRIKIKKEAE